jgi:uncharacterized damage-inducible protein DinB
MTEVERIVDQYDRVLGGEAWHGDPVWQILDGVSAETAAARPLSSAHTIWELLLHIMYWETVVNARLENRPNQESEELNFPAMPKATQANWQQTLAEFRASNARFRQALTQLDPKRLDELAVIDKKSFYVEAHGLIQHHVYHLGQIAILKKAGEKR